MEPPVEGDTVRIALGRDRWKLKRRTHIGSDEFGVLERLDGNGSVITYAKYHQLVKVED